MHHLDDDVMILGVAEHAPDLIDLDPSVRLCRDVLLVVDAQYLGDLAYLVLGGGAPCVPVETVPSQGLHGQIRLPGASLP